MIAYWPFESFSNDASGNNHAIITDGQARLANEVHIMGHSVLSMTSNGDFAVSGDNINLGDVFTICFWVHVNSSTGGLKTFVANTRSGYQSNGFKIFANTYGTTDGRIILETGNGSVGTQTTSLPGIYSQDKDLYIAVVVNRSTGVATIYADGKDVTQNSGNHRNFANNAPVRLGSMTNGVFWCNTYMDDVKIFGKLLSLPEIKTNMNGYGPNQLTLQNKIRGNMHLEWIDNCATEVRYDIERSSDSLSGYKILTSTTQPGNYIYDDQLSTPASKFFYRVRAFNGTAYTNYSNIVSVKTRRAEQYYEVIHFPWDNSLADSSGNNLISHLNGASFTTNHVRGTHSLAFNDFSQSFNTEFFDFSEEFTMMFWLYLNESAYNEQTILTGMEGIGGLYNNSRFRVTVNANGNFGRTIRLQSYNYGILTETVSLPVYDFNQWAHITLLVNRNTGKASIYINGKDATMSQGSHLSLMTSSYIIIGGQFYGMVDDFRLYDHQLSDREIKLLMNGDYSFVYLPPSELKVTLNDSLKSMPFGMYLLLTWKDNSNVEKRFTLERNGALYDVFVGENSTWFDDHYVFEGGYYTYRVKADSAYYRGPYYTDYSNSASYLIPYTSIPYLKTGKITKTSVEFNWKDIYETESGYIMYYSTDSLHLNNTVTMGTNQTNLVINNLQPATRYYFKLKCFNPMFPDDSIPASKTIAVVTHSDAPSDLITTSVASRSVTLEWVDNSPSEDGFIMERSPNAVTGYQPIATLPANITTYTDTALSSSTRYFYRLRFYKGTTKSDYSNYVGITTLFAFDNTLKVYWPLDSSFMDASGNHHDLNPYNYPYKPVPFVQPRVGSFAYGFPAEEPLYSSEGIDLGNSFTICFWAKVDAANNIATLVANTRSGNGNGFKLMVNTYNTIDRRLILETGDGKIIRQTKSNTNVFALNQWNHVAVVVNRSAGTAQLYYNGNNVTAIMDMQKNFNVNYNIWLGNMVYDYYASWPLTGNLDDVRIYNSELTRQQIQTIMSVTTTPGSPAIGYNNALPVSKAVQMKESEIIESQLDVVSQAVFPNPFTNSLSIKSSGFKIVITDVSGKVKVEIATPDEVVYLDTENWSKGIYLVKIKQPDGTEQVYKVVKL